MVGAGTDSAEGWAALVSLAERLVRPSSRSRSERVPARRTIGSSRRPSGRPAAPARKARAVRRAPRRRRPGLPPVAVRAGTLDEAGTRIAVVGDNPDEVHRSPAELAVLAARGDLPRARRAFRSARRRSAAVPAAARPEPPAAGEPLRPVTSSPRSPNGSPRGDRRRGGARRPAELHDRLLAREPLGFLSAAMAGWVRARRSNRRRMALPERPVVAVVGDGSSLYGIQALWSAAHYRVGVLFVILVNRGTRSWTGWRSAAGPGAVAGVPGRHRGDGDGPGLRRAPHRHTTSSSPRSRRPCRARHARGAVAPRRGDRPTSTFDP